MCMFIAMVKINIKAIKLEEITVTFHPTKPKKPIIIKTEKKQLNKGTNTQIILLNTNQRVAIMNKKTPAPKTIMSFLINVIISSAIMGIPPR